MKRIKQAWGQENAMHLHLFNQKHSMLELWG